MLERFRDPDGFAGYRSPLLAECGVPHLFTTRRGAGGELDAGRLEPAAAARLRCAAGAPAAELASARQVHGAAVIGVERELGECGAADALFTTRPDRLLLVRTADCVPLLLASDDGARVAAVHAGWRGLLAGVVPNAIGQFDGAPLVAAIGACLSLARFEVGPEVALAFERADLAAAVHERPGARAHVDLRAACAIQLERAGVARIDVSDRCTWDEDDDFWSYRRDVTHGPRERTGSLAALIAPQAREGAR